MIYHAFRQSSSCFTNVTFPTGFFRTFNIIGNIMLMVCIIFDLTLNLLLSLLPEYAHLVTIFFGKLYSRVFADFINFSPFCLTSGKTKRWDVSLLTLFLFLLFEQRGSFPFLDAIVDQLLYFSKTNKIWSNSFWRRPVVEQIMYAL